MAFHPGHPPYRRRTALAVVGEEDVIDLPVLPPTRRWQASDMDDWLFTRLQHRWEIGDDRFWRNKLIGYAGLNDCLFVTNVDAVMLAMMSRHPMTGKPVVSEVFAWARSADLRDGSYGLDQGSNPGTHALRALYKHMREWAKSMAATRVYTGICSDIVPSTLKDMLPGGYYVVGGPCS